ncbi:MAG: hypothetical protein KatS3mg048_1928 [Caldilinea sp.]|nr:MAG: hypothetical protein KatS3mg048_1928 [Caldilinea sp.]
MKGYRWAIRLVAILRSAANHNTAGAFGQSLHFTALKTLKERCHFLDKKRL